MINVMITGGACVLSVLVVAIALRLCVRKVRAGEALVIHTPARARVVREGGALVLPIVHHAERIDTRPRVFVYGQDDTQILTDLNGDRFRFRARFDMLPGSDQHDLLRLARTLGPDRLADLDALQEFYGPMLLGATRLVARQFVLSRPATLGAPAVPRGFHDTLVEYIGADLGGFTLSDALIDDLRPVS